MRMAQLYSVNLYDHELRSLGNGIVNFRDGLMFFLNEMYYDEEYGLQIEGTAGLSLSMIN